ncbi:MAG: hypothetical protein KC468_13055 [Myxococcales bacterium]|nr:hypothetical protein [Myxococcales bacterium]
MRVKTVVLSALGTLPLLGGVACDNEARDERAESGVSQRSGDDNNDDSNDDSNGDSDECDNVDGLVEDVRALVAHHGLSPLAAPEPIRAELVTLGRALFHDKILSGQRDVSCGTCHNPGLGLADARPLFSGVGGSGVGLDRVGGQVGGRHSQTLFNLHALETLAIDGKVEQVAGGVVHGFGLPLLPPEVQAAFEDFPAVLRPRVVAAQALGPQATAAEMLGFAGQDPDNEIVECVTDVPSPEMFACIFERYMTRLGQIPEYVDMFENAYGAPYETLNFGHVGNAIAAYELAAFTSNNSPWDQFLAGDDCALTNNQLRGARRFLDEGAANCVGCHSGDALTDNQFHQTLAPQFGCGSDVLGRRNGPNGLDDFGRVRNVFELAFAWIFYPSSSDAIFPVEQRYAWRTPPLRNVEFTAPYGRLGQFSTLEEYVTHYMDPEVALVEFDITQLPDTAFDNYSGFACQAESLHQSLVDNADAILDAGVDPALAQVSVDDKKQVKQLVEFLKALSDEGARPEVLVETIPDSVPSGLPVDHP